MLITITGSKLLADKILAEGQIIDPMPQPRSLFVDKKSKKRGFRESNSPKNGQKGNQPSKRMKIERAASSEKVNWKLN
jgi:hypothetical protein